MNLNPSDEPNYWRKQAEEAWSLAAEMTDAHTKALMVTIAKNYEQIAKSVEDRLREPRLVLRPMDRIAAIGLVIGCRVAPTEGIPCQTTFVTFVAETAQRRNSTFTIGSRQESGLPSKWSLPIKWFRHVSCVRPDMPPSRSSMFI
jgi:hypothetical protein